MDEDQKPALLRNRRLIVDKEKKENPTPLPVKRPATFWVYVLFGGITMFALLLEVFLPILDLAVFQYIGKALALILVMALVGWGWYRFLRMLAQGKTWAMNPYVCSYQIVSLSKDSAWLFYFFVLINLIVLGGTSGWAAAVVSICIL